MKTINEDNWESQWDSYLHAKEARRGWHPSMESEWEILQDMMLEGRDLRPSKRWRLLLQAADGLLLTYFNSPKLTREELAIQLVSRNICGIAQWLAGRD